MAQQEKKGKTSYSVGFTGLCFPSSFQVWFWFGYVGIHKIG